MHFKFHRMFSAAACAEKPPMLCIGHSHLHCVQAASARSGIAIDAIDFWADDSVVVDYPDNPSLASDIQRRFLDCTSTAFSFIGGGAHVVVGLLSHPRRFDFVLPKAPWLPLNSQAEVLPIDAIRAVLLEQAQPALKLMLHVRSLTRRLVHMESPAPCADERFLRQRIPWSLFPGMLREVAPRPVRYKLWRLHSQIVAEFCADHDIEFVSHPSQSVDEDGFLRREYSHDGIHANSKYGRLLLRQMQEAP